MRPVDIGPSRVSPPRRHGRIEAAVREPDNSRPGLLAETFSRLAVLALELFQFPPQGLPVDAVAGLL